jgi:5-amino-6-(5-phosphoribosylamino)uracil reductase
MGAHTETDDRPAKPTGFLLERLLPPGVPAGAEEIVEGLGYQDRAATRASRPYLILNMVSTVDGRASIEGRSGPLGDPSDRELFRALRDAADAVVVGAGTARTERYRRIIPDAARRRRRRERGLSEEPLACIVSGRLDLPADLPLLTDPAVRVVVITCSPASLPASGAHIDYVRTERQGRLDLPAALAELRRRFATRVLLCEGGPHLNSELFADGLVDELFLSLSPKLAGEDAHPGGTLRILAGGGLEHPVELDLLGTLRSDSRLFLRYAVCVSGR